MKKYLILSLMLIFMLSLPLSATAENAEKMSGVCGENARWSISDGVLTISGEGGIFNYGSADRAVSVQKAPWDGLKEEIREVVIDEGITSIGQSAFYECKQLEKVTLPESLTEIGYGAFSQCASLEKVDIPEKVTKIGRSAFSHCYALEEVQLSASLGEIEAGTFYECESLGEIEIPVGIKSIGQAAFSKSGLGSVNIPKNVETIGIEAFSDCKNMNVLTFEYGVKSILNSAFAGCSAIIGTELPESLTKLDPAVFYECFSLYSVTLPSSLKTIGDGAFAYCTTLAEINMREGVENIGYESFSNCTTLKSLKTPSSLRTIGAYAFEGCIQLENVRLNEGLEIIGVYSFRSCSALTNFIVPKGVRNISAGMLSHCSKLRNLVIPETVEYIGASLIVSCSKIQNVFFGGSEKQWKELMNPSNRVCFTEVDISFETNGEKEMDNPSDWAADYIRSADALDLIPGEFACKWTRNTTRSEFCLLAKTLIEKYTGKALKDFVKESENPPVSFTDTEDETCLLIAQLGIVNGYEDGSFQGDYSINRREAAVMLTRTAQALGFDTQTAASSVFADFEDVPEWAKEGVLFVGANSIMNGISSENGDIIFDGGGIYTREQSAVTFYRLYCFVTGEKL